MTSARITLRRTPKGVSIRATGSAAQALFDAICHDTNQAMGSVAKASTGPAVLRLQIVVTDHNNTYEARAVNDTTTVAAGLTGVRATCTAGERQALDALLAKAAPPRRVARVIEQHVGPGRRDTYTIEAEIA